MLRLKELRKEKGNTQAEIAQIIGITRAAYTNIENGKREPDIDTVLKLASYFDVSTDYIYGLSNDKKPTLLSESGLTPDGMRIAEKVSQLSEHHKKAVEDYIAFLKTKENQ